ncbi:hypothetical protein H4J50_16395 [Colwellia sp. 6M3]|uniref:hypothetical protein n=1 Tax=Colwellia sp. 6M3 TaxID=2759849 RepID=UPI0015F6D032|nr:hypothetical protein [Colwellia sp. 6M3]MBA6417590.1 hypothetical protein [Colwellia sp. 6M3]|tara:strand:- start:19229 stop:20020 length:792 start_codon:yes stop_codon:yes gene_type:complete
MALTWDSTRTDTISFDEFVEYFKKQGSNPVSSNLEGAVDMMQRLYNNREFLAQAIVDQQLKKIANEYTSEVLILHRSEHFLVRAVVWLPVNEKENSELNHFEDIHDHNFNFITVGYLGDGYESNLWEYDIDDVVGEVGENVDFSFIERTKLKPQRVMYLRKGVDVHQQIPPSEMSVSVNVLELNKKNENQYFFDIDSIDKPNAKIAQNINPPLASTLSKMMGQIGKSEIVLDKLSNLSFPEKSAQEKIRQEAINESRKFSVIH